MSNRLTLALPYIDIGYEGAVKALKEYFKSLKSKGQLPISIFTVMSPLALAALNAAKELGIQSPENIKILSGDENEAFAMLTPPVSAFNAPLYKMGKRSAECLLKRIKGRKDPFEKSSLIMELTERKSCGE
jgi:LacI family transcriptional regulator